MICRLWRGWTTKSNADPYERFMRGEVLPAIVKSGIPGLDRFEILRRESDDGVEFVTLMWFENLDAVKSFAGEDYETASVSDTDRALLREFDPKSLHFEVLDRHAPRP